MYLYKGYKNPPSAGGEVAMFKLDRFKFILLTTFLLFAGAQVEAAYADTIYMICHGELEQFCSAHSYTTFEPCSFTGGGANPPASVAFMCGTKPGGKPNGVTGGSGGPSVGGNKCGYSWFEVHCFD